MSEMNRRQFLAAGAAGTAGLVMENKGALLRTPEKPWNAHAERILRKFRDPIPTACVACEARCAVTATRDGARVVQLTPNRKVQVPGNTCPRAYETLEGLYDPQRVLRPRRRAGKRGEGKWEEISWAEAVDQLARAVAAAPDGTYMDLARPDPLAGALLGRLGVSHIIEDAASRAWTAREAQRAVYGLPLAEPDLTAARTVLLVGARPLDGWMPYPFSTSALTDAKARGARLIAVGAYQGATGSVAEEWIPARPGTEGLVLLGLARVILSQGWYDREALPRMIGAPTEKIFEALGPYRADLVEAAAGIPALTLVRLARRFADHGPSLCITDSSGSRSAGAVEAAAAVLNSLHGDPEGVGVRLDRAPEWVPRLEPTLPRARALKDILAGNERASVYLAYRSNPVYWSPRSDSVRRAFAEEGRVGLLVALDTMMTETAEVADLVLPAAADLELWNLFGGFTGEGRAYAVLQQPTPHVPAEAVMLEAPDVPLEQLFTRPPERPLGEARQLGDVLLEMLAATSHPARADFPFSDAGAYVRHLVDGVPALAADGGFEALSRTGVWLARAPSYPRAAEEGYPTSTGTLDVGGRLVHQVPSEFRQLKEGTFALVVLRYFELDPAYANSRWGREIRYENPVYMNAGVARKLGLGRGAKVLVRTRVGEAIGHVTPIEGIHPQAVAVAEDFGHWAGGVAATAQAKATGEEPAFYLLSRRGFLDNPLGIDRKRTQPGQIPWWHESGPGLSLSALSPFVSEPGGAQAWREIPVTIHPA